jgi:hypothetical protein
MGAIAGRVLRQHRTDHGGVTVTVSVGGTQQGTATTAADGSFSLQVPPGTVSVRASRLGYLPAERTGVVVTAGATAPLPEVTLVAGEVDGDASACITPLDTGLIISALGSAATPPDDARDINGDGTIDYPDLTLAADNGGLCGPMSW